MLKLPFYYCLYYKVIKTGSINKNDFKMIFPYKKIILLPQLVRFFNRQTTYNK